MAIKSLTKLNLQSIYKDFSNVVRERKRDFIGPFNKIYGFNKFNGGIGMLFKNNELFSNLITRGNTITSNENNSLTK